MLVAVILTVLVINSTSSSCDSSKILTWIGKYKSGVIAGARVGNTNWGLGSVNTNWGPGPGARAGKPKDPFSEAPGGQIKKAI